MEKEPVVALVGGMPAKGDADEEHVQEEVQEEEDEVVGVGLGDAALAVPPADLQLDGGSPLAMNQEVKGGNAAVDQLQGQELNDNGAAVLGADPAAVLVEQANKLAALDLVQQEHAQKVTGLEDHIRRLTMANRELSSRLHDMQSLMTLVLKKMVANDRALRCGSVEFVSNASSWLQGRGLSDEVKESVPAPPAGYNVAEEHGMFVSHEPKVLHVFITSMYLVCGVTASLSSSSGRP